MSLKEVLVFLARMDSGCLKGRDAVNVVMRTGLIPNRKSADAQIYTLLNRDETFYKIATGEYQLADKPSETSEFDRVLAGDHHDGPPPDDVDDLPF